MHKIAFEAIGTKWLVEIEDKLSLEQSNQLKNKIILLCQKFDKTFSRFRADSIVAEMSRKSGQYKLPDDALPLLSLYQKLYKDTRGIFTPLIGQVLSDAGYDSAYSLKPKKEIASPPKWEEALDFKFPVLTLKKPALLDFGAGGKGHLVDILSKFISDAGIKNFCVDGSGDMFYKNNKNKTMSIGLEHPKHAGQVIGTINLASGQSLCASAGNRRVWGKYHHIINPATLKSPKTVIASWVVADSALLADTLATALILVPPSWLKNKYNFSYLIVKSDYTYYKDKTFGATIFDGTN